MQNTSVYFEKVKQNDRETEMNLGQLDYRLNKGWDRSVMHRGEIAQRASYYTEKV